MQNYHIIKVVTLGATNTKPARVKIISERFKQSIIVPFDNEPDSRNPSIETAIKCLNSVVYFKEGNGNPIARKGFNIIGQGEGSDHYYLISTTFEPIK